MLVCGYLTLLKQNEHIFLFSLLAIVKQIVLFNTLILISLFVTLTVVKQRQSVFIKYDLRVFYSLS